MANNDSSNSGTGASAPANGANDYQRTKEYLEDAASHVTERDIDRLNTTMPNKLKQLDMSELNDGMQWIGTLIERGTTLFEMIRNKEFNITGRSKTLIAAGLIYLVLPFDLAPDFIPGIGYLDDALVLSTLWKIVQSEVDRYMAYRQAVGE